MESNLLGLLVVSWWPAWESGLHVCSCPRPSILVLCGERGVIGEIVMVCV